ncbi:MAG: glycosyltransferase [Myxococcaceae bacterium]|nr:glycosyltransferase [Myxococcaceae bacterium]MBH2006788.1 glycosyltransferase [Myxococcaceae bacterium]
MGKAPNEEKQYRRRLLSRHIVLVIPDLGKAGAERILTTYANHWVSVGYKVTIILLIKDARIEYKLNKKIKLLIIPILKYFKLKIIDSVFSWFCIFKLRKAIVALSPCIVISFMVDLESIIALSGLDVPLIVSLHADPVYRDSKTKLYRKILIKLFYHNAFKIHLLTDSAANFFNYLKNVLVIPNPVNRAKVEKLELIFPCRKLVSIGQLIPSKRFDILIEAFSRVLSQFEDLRLEIYGEGPERNALEQLIDHLKLKSRVFLPGIRDDIDSLLFNSDIFVSSSETESFGMAVCEAMAVGCVVVGSNCSGLNDVIQDRVNGRLFNVGSVDHLSKILIELLSDQNQCRLLSKNAKKIVDRFSSEKVFKLWDTVFLEAGFIKPVALM